MTSLLPFERHGLLDRYLQAFRAEHARLAQLAVQLATDSEEIYSRRNMRGHITSSALVLNRQRTRVLLVHHVALDRWLPPGGHYDAPQSLWESARREVQEEAGVSCVLHPWCAARNLPIDIDTHPIAANPRQDDGAHFHHDFMYLATASEGLALVAQLQEVHAARWVDLGDLPGTDARLVKVLRKCRALDLIS